MGTLKTRCLILILDLLLWLQCWYLRVLDSRAISLLLTFYLNLSTYLRLQWRGVLRCCLGCGAGARLPGRTVCNQCSARVWQKFGLHTGR